MSDLRDALDQIRMLASGSTTYTKRLQRIHDVAMRGLGMTATQRAVHFDRAEKRAAEIVANRRAKGNGEAKRQFKAALRESEQ